VHRVCVERHVFQLCHTQLQQHFPGVSASTAHRCNVKTVSWQFQDTPRMKKHDVLITKNMQMQRDPYIWQMPKHSRFLFPQPVLLFPIMLVYIQLLLGTFVEAKKQKYCYILLWHKQKQRKLSKKMFNTTMTLYFIQNYWLNVYYDSLTFRHRASYI
jgi:hypothetical protein